MIRKLGLESVLRGRDRPAALDWLLSRQRAMGDAYAGRGRSEHLKEHPGFGLDFMVCEAELGFGS